MSSHADGGLVAIKVAPAAEITRPIDGLPVAVSITPPAGKERMPVDICCVIDISWSMSMEAKVQGQAGNVDSNGLSMLDIAKHAVRTIIRSLDARDRISIVQFCRDAQVVLSMTEMTPEGQQMAEAKLDVIGFGSATNLWAGIEKGFECLTGDGVGSRMGHMILLTDGEVTEGKENVLPNIKSKLQAQGSAVESNGLSMLDIAKHAVRTIIRSLDSKDRLSIVQFCRDANIMLEMTEMTEAGQKEAEARLDDIGFGSATNLWAGIEKGFGCLAGDRGGRMGHMILLTDGEVTEGKDQVLPNLKKFKHENKKLPGTICVFGFGYEIDSTMLVEIADFSDGSYAFIPDAGFVGTVFVNCISNLQVTMAQNVILTLETGQEAEISEVLGGWDAQRSEKGTWTISLGTLQYSQTKDIVLRMKIKNDKERYLFAAVEYTTLAGPQPPIKAEGIPPGEPEDFRKAQVQHCRSMAVGSLRQAVASALVTESTEETLKQGQQMVIELADRIKESDAKDDPQVQALLEDVTGQCTEALSRLDYWVKWGRHYIPSVISAHKMEQCNNFKDPG
eukprot:CAMPEP_0115559086 /NCGR_PEP_ID=MMETSP0271-20121206/99780_1 /TAXON_ID=71861 /ORGANISM="Scrippsiella trochoidea, Strain CCMP3099" /LENGTH=561 /DNA_ID=CAMNT_0002993137 /DNA_START=90 /DNA_END=1771 /DNA_ORIENTATION=+